MASGVCGGLLGIRLNCNYLVYCGDCVYIQGCPDKDCRIFGNADACSLDAFTAASLAGQGEAEASIKLTLVLSYCLFPCCFWEMFNSVLAQTTHR